MDRSMTAFAPFERKTVPPHAETHIPSAPPLPTRTDRDPTEPAPSQLDQMGERIANLSDAVFDPAGLLHALFAELDRKAALRHEETMRTLTTHANGQIELSDRLAKLEPEVERHDAELRIVATRSAE